MTEPTDIVVAKNLPPAELVSAHTEADANSFVSVIQRRWRTMILVSTFFAATLCAAIWYAVKPQYQVSASVHVSPTIAPVLFKDAQTDISRQYGEYLATQAQMMISPVVIRQTLNAPEVRSLPSIIKAPIPEIYLASHLEVERIRGTQLLEVRMVGEHPQEMATIINSLLKAYLRVCEDRQRKWDDKVLRSLRAEQAELTAKLQAVTVELRQRTDETGLTLSGASGANIEAWVTEIRRLLIEAQDARALAMARLESFAAGDGTGDHPQEAGDLDVGELEAYLLRDPERERLALELRSLELAQLDDERLRRGPRHPDVIGRRARIAKLQEELAAREDRLSDLFRRSLRRKLEGDQLDAEIRARVLQTELDRVLAHRTEVARVALEVEDVRHERERLEQASARVRDKIWNVEIEQNRMARVTIDSPAVAPEAPNIDKRMKYSAAACFMSLVMGAGVAFLRHRLDTSVRDPREVTVRLGVPLLGSVQYIPNANGADLANNVRMLNPIRGISAALLASSSNGKPHSRLITSPTARSGKSSMALNLAKSLASTGRAVLLVDADNSGQGVTRALELVGQPGLKELLEGGCRSDQAVYRNDIEELRVLPAGKYVEHFGDLLVRQRAQETVKSLFGAYDDVIVDSPPVLASSNAVVLAALVDEVILVLRAGKSTHEEAQAACHVLSSVGDKLIGVILNAVEQKRSAYAYYYGYPQSETAINI